MLHADFNKLNDPKVPNDQRFYAFTHRPFNVLNDPNDLNDNNDVNENINQINQNETHPLRRP